MLVSVVIPCYNVKEYIRDCIASVINQTYCKLEIICVDNNSTDDTWNILLELKSEIPELIIEKEMNAGAPAARNRGLNVARGEWIQFLDADDLLIEKKIEHQIKMLKSTKAPFVAAAWYARDTKGFETPVSELSSDVYTAVFLNKCGITSSNLWNKNALLTIGGWDESLKSSQEADLMMRMVLAGHKYIVDTTPLTIVRERESGQISQRDPAPRWKQYIEVRLKYLSRLEELFPDVYYKNKNLYYEFLLVSIITLARFNKKEAIKIFNAEIKNHIGFSSLRSIFIKLFGLRLFLSLK